jgi:DNA-directed RNA polymerase alpha subunit
MTDLAEYPVKDELYQLELSVRVEKGLRSAGITTVAQMRALTWSDVRKIPNLHRKSWNEIRACVEDIDGTSAYHREQREEEAFYRWVREHRTSLEALRRGEALIIFSDPAVEL